MTTWLLLAALAFEPLAPGSVRTDGWLRKELEKQREGLAGHAEELYPEIGKSDWLTNAGVGGEYAWERGPYFARGLVALAFALDDAKLKEQAKKWVEAVLDSQRPDGDFGPRANNWWANMLPLAYLRDWAEATGDVRVVPFFERYFRYQQKTFAEHPLNADSCWAKARAGDELESVLWLARQTGDSAWLDFAKTVAAQSADWTAYYRDGGDPSGAAGYRVHIVNFMQGLKFPALRWSLFGDAADFRAYDDAFRPDGWAMRRAGRPDGMLNGSEPLADRSTTGGTELCAIAERILSCRTVLSVTGNPAAADDLEDVAYNALPATLAPDGKGIRYYLLLNQPACIDKGLLFANNGFGSQVTGAICPGPHSGFGCCRSNFHVAWPKVAESMWMRKEGGLAAVVHGPSRVTAELPCGRVTLAEETEYPYSGRIVLRVMEGGGRFPIFVRVPRWAKAADAGTFRRYDGEWKSGDSFVVDFPMETELSFWNRQSVAVRRGPLLYALKIKAKRTAVASYQVPYEKRACGADGFPRWELTPETPWNYALALTDGRLGSCETVGTGEGLELRVKAFRTSAEGWGTMRTDAPARAGEPPQSPVAAELTSEPETISLVPIAKTELRITLFPWRESGVWCYRPYECEAWLLQRTRAEADRGILHFGYPGSFLRLDREPACFYSATPVDGYESVAGTPDVPPHRREFPETRQPLSCADGLYDRGTIDIGYVRARAAEAPRLFVGESLPEVRASDTNGFEQSTKMIEEAPGRWRSEIPLALRYFRFETPVEDVAFDSQVDWRANPGEPPCDDPRLRRMWTAGVETLRRCTRHFLLDGLKRDRMPWAADLVMATLAEARSFRNAEIVKRELAALGSGDPKETQVNGILAYSLWWVIGHEVFQRHFGDDAYLRLHYPRICERMDELVGHEDARGFVVKGLGWDFMDWTDSDSGELKSETTRQVIYFGAVRAAACLAGRMGDVAREKRWREKASRLGQAILAGGMDGTRHARMLAIVFDLVSGETAQAYAREIAAGNLPPTVTPYMAAFETMALLKGGQPEAARRRLEAVWGRMIDSGCDTYWEGWDDSQTGDDRYRYYSRPFGKSLCHAWSAAPVFLVPWLDGGQEMELLGDPPGGMYSQGAGSGFDREPCGTFRKLVVSDVSIFRTNGTPEPRLDIRHEPGSALGDVSISDVVLDGRVLYGSKR